MSGRWTGRGSGFAVGCLVSAVTVLGATAPNAFADTSPINAVPPSVDLTTEDSIAAVDEVVTSDITDPIQETSVDASIQTTTDPTAGAPDTTNADTAAAGTTVAAADAVPDETSHDPVGVMDAASETPEEPQEALQAIDVASADVTSTGATTDTDPVTDAAAVTLDGAKETTSDAIGVSSDVTADATIGTSPVEAVSDGQPTLDATVMAAEATTDVAAMIADAATVANDVVETPVATDGTGVISGQRRRPATVSSVAPVETVTGTTSTTSDAAATVSDTSSEVTTGVEDALVPSNLAAQTIVDSTTTITSATEGAGPDGTTDAAQTLSEAASAVIAAVSDDDALADPTTVPNEATETDVFSLDAASLRRIQGGTGPMRDEESLLSLNRGQTEGERFPGNEPVASCEDAASPSCALTGSSDGIDSLVESVASIIRILALTGLTLLPWVAAAGMLASLGGLALSASRRRRATGSLSEATLPRGSHVKDAWAYS